MILWGDVYYTADGYFLRTTPVYPSRRAGILIMHSGKRNIFV